MLEQMLRRRQMTGAACVELSKLYEHRLKDYPAALDYAQKSSRYPDGEEPERLEARLARIRKKMTASTEA